MRKMISQAAGEVRERISSASQCDTEKGAIGIDTIPSPLVPPTYSPLSDTAGNKICFFDLETTSFSGGCDIIQVAACHNGDTYNRYVIPKQPILPSVSEVTGIEMFFGKMLHNGNHVAAVSPYAALAGLIEWLEERQPAILAAHNCKTFDANRLVYHLEKNDLLDKFQNVVTGFLDTLPLFKATFKLPNYKLPTIVSNTLNQSFTAHNASEDAEMLENAYNASTSAFEQEKICLARYTFKTAEILHRLKCGKEKTRNLQTLQPLLKNKVIGLAMVEKIASSGLNMHNIRLAYNRDKANGIQHLFTELNSNGAVRVTKNKKIISKVVTYLSG